MTEKMKPSGIAWIGDIPTSWQVKKIKYYTEIVNGSTPDSSDFNCWDGPIKWITPADMDNTGIISEGERTLTLYGYNSCGTTMLPKGSIVISSRAPIGKINITGDVLCTNQGCKSLVGETDNRYLYYLLLAGQEELVRLGRGTTFIELGTYDLANFGIVLPKVTEQLTIADFLDAQCAKIDSVIVDIEKQIETLQKYKKSLITEAVTKGLDRSVPMKDSGNSWYSAVPKHWKICRIKDVIDLLTDYTANGSFQSLADNVEYLDYESFARVIRLTDLRVNMTNYGIYVDEHAYEFLAKSALFGGEILVANVGAYAGLFCEMPKVTYKATLGPNMYMILTNKDIVSQHYLYLLGQCNNVCEQLNIKATASAQPKLNKADVKGVYIPIPPVKEQMEIERYLDDKLKRVDLIIEDKQRQLDAVQQCKKSLIYEYVTGKKRVTEVN